MSRTSSSSSPLLLGFEGIERQLNRASMTAGSHSPVHRIEITSRD